MRYVTIGARVLLGLIYTVFGLNFFLNFIPVPPMPEPAAKFMEVFVSGRYIHLVKVCEVVFGALLLSGFFVPLALTVLAPITIGILVFHLFTVPDPVMAIVMVLLQGFLAYQYRAAFKPLLSMQYAGPQLGAEGR